MPIVGASKLQLRSAYCAWQHIDGTVMRVKKLAELYQQKLHVGMFPQRSIDHVK